MNKKKEEIPKEIAESFSVIDGFIDESRASDEILQAFKAIEPELNEYRDSVLHVLNAVDNKLTDKGNYWHVSVISELKRILFSTVYSKYGTKMEIMVFDGKNKKMTGEKSNE